MAPFSRILIVTAATLMSTAALAQFGTLFGPPRPPADVGPPGRAQPPPPPQRVAPQPPVGGLPQMPPEEMDEDAQPPQVQPRAPVARTQPPQQPLPPQQPGAPVRSQPLPPPGQPPQQSAVPPGQTVVPPVPQTAPGQAARGAPPAPATTAPQPGDEVVVEMPSQKIANPTAVFTGLDKVTGRTIAFDVALNETVQFGALQVTPRVCYTRPATESSNTDAFIEVDEVTLQGEVKRLFAGWIFASSPGLNAVEHPIYDVWLKDCKGGTTVVADTPPPAQAAPQPRQQQRPQQQQPGQQPSQQQRSQAAPAQPPGSVAGQPTLQQQLPAVGRQPLQQPAPVGPPPGFLPGR